MTNTPLTDVSIADYGAHPAASAAVNTAAIQKAIDAGARLGTHTRFPAGEYRVQPDTSVTDETGAAFTCFLMRANMHLDFERGCTLKIANGISSAASPKQMRMFFTNEVLSNISFSGGVLDMNGANNRISRKGGPYSRLNQAHIWVSGTPAGVAARVDDVLIEDMQFLNSPGTTSICMAQSNTAGVTLGKRWTIQRNTFVNNGFDTDDHSTIFGWADDVLCEENTFIGVAASLAISNCVSYEVHGARCRYCNNTVRSHYQGLWVAQNFTSAVDGTVVSNNQFTDMYGVVIDHFRNFANDFPVSNTIISGNYMELNDAAPGTGITLKVGVQVAAFYAIDGVTVVNNTLVKNGTKYASAFANVTTQSVARQKHTRLTFSTNRSRGATFGVHLATTAVNGLGAIDISDNEFLNLTPTAVFTQAIGVAFVSGSSPIDALTTGGNTTSGGQYGEYLTGSIRRLIRRDKDVRQAPSP